MKLLGSVKTRVDFAEFYRNAKWPVNAGCVVPPDSKLKQMFAVLCCYTGSSNVYGFPYIRVFVLDAFTYGTRLGQVVTQGCFSSVVS